MIHVMRGGAGAILAVLLAVRAATAQDAAPETDAETAAGIAAEEPAAETVSEPVPDGILDGPEVAAVLLDLLTEGAPERLELPVVGAADAAGAKWVRALAPHPDWPVLRPFAARMGFDCAPDWDRAAEPACWRMLDGEVVPAADDAPREAAPGDMPALDPSTLPSVSVPADARPDDAPTAPEADR